MLLKWPDCSKKPQLRGFNLLSDKLFKFNFA